MLPTVIEQTILELLESETVFTLESLLSETRNLNEYVDFEDSEAMEFIDGCVRQQQVEKQAHEADKPYREYRHKLVNMGYTKEMIDEVDVINSTRDEDMRIAMITAFKEEHGRTPKVIPLKIS